MKTDFAILIKSMRLTFRPDFKIITINSILTPEQLDQALLDLEEKQGQMIIDNGYTQEEFDLLYREYFMDFSSENPDEWIIKHDPENAQIISGN
jgi:hypothetical protein